MVTPVENAIHHVRLCAEIEHFSEPQKAVITRLLNSDEPAMLDVMAELKALRDFDGSAAAAGARITRIEDYLNAIRLLKSTMVTRLMSQPEPDVLTPALKPYKTVKFPLERPKKAARSKKVVELFPGK